MDIGLILLIQYPSSIANSLSLVLEPMMQKLAGLIRAKDNLARIQCNVVLHV